MALVAIPFGLAIGLAVGTVGGGGSVLAIPVLVYVLGENVHAATTSSLIVVAAAAIAGGIGHGHSGSVCWRYAAAFAPPATIGVAAGTVANRGVGSGFLLALFAIVMLVAALATWRNVTGEDQRMANGSAGCPPLEVSRTASAGLLVGLLTGIFGVGGGFVIVPVLAIALNFPIRRAIATSLVIVSAVSAVGLGAHLLAGATLDVGITAAMTVACAVGAMAGAAVAPRVSHTTLGRGFALLLGLVATYLLVAVAFLGGPPQG